MNRKDSLGSWLGQRREALDLTQHELADRVECSAVTIRKIESVAAKFLARLPSFRHLGRVNPRQ